MFISYNTCSPFLMCSCWCKNYPSFHPRLFTMIGSVYVKMQLYLVKEHEMKTRGKVYLYLHQVFIFGLSAALR